jgi:surface antigen
MKSKQVLWIALTAIPLLAFSDDAQAAGLTNVETCTSTSYACQTWSYTGTDPYGYYKFSTKAPNGTLHNCTAYAAYMLSLRTGYDPRWATLGNASTWASRAKSFGLPVGQTPHVGDVAQWNFGHVAFVEQVNSDSAGKVVSIVVTDDNFNRAVTTRKTIYSGASTGVIPYPDNFISFPSTGGGGRPAVAVSEAPDLG